MLQSIRDKTSGWIASIVLGLVILTMAFFGIESYLTPKVESYVARIEGPPTFLRFGKQVKEIRQDEFRKRFDQVRRQQRETEGEAFDPAAFESVTNKRLVLDQLVDEALLGLLAERDGVVLPKAAIQKSIMSIDAFKVAGKFNANQYQLALQSQGMTPQQFQDIVQADLVQRMIPNELAASGFASDAELDAYIRMGDQTRDLRYLAIPPLSIVTLDPTDAELKAWYDAHAAKYRSPERVAVEYVELKAASMPVDSSADEAMLRERYVAAKTRFGAEEQRMASHILVKLDAKATPAQVEATRRKAVSFATQARQPNADFAALATANSEDLGSKDVGGDLGPVAKGVFGDAFDKAFDALKPGQVSDPVRLPDGWHVLYYRQLVAGTTKPFEEVRPELEAEYMESERERVFNDVSGKLVDLIYAQPGALTPAAAQLKLPVQRTGLFTAQAGDGVAALPQVRKAAFVDAQRLDRQVSDPIEVEPNHVVLIHVIDHQPAAATPLAAVRTQVSADLRADRAQKAAKARAQAILARAQKGETLDVLGLELGQVASAAPAVGRRAPSPELAPLVTEAFRLPRPEVGKPGVALAQLGPNRYALVTVTKVVDGDPAKMDPATRASLKDQLAKARGSVDSRAFTLALRKQYSVQVAEDRL